jgi:uncharacterized protein (DUF697 family)/GTPase SAR1 family protein
VPEADKRRDRIQHAVDQARRVAEQGARDLADAISRGLQDVTERALPRKKSADSNEADAAGPSVEEVAEDPAAFFRTEQQKETEKLGHANILITGQTGAGKSTLVNSFFRVPLAAEGVGKPVTDHVQRHEVPGVPVTIFDTPGIELGHAKKDVIREFKKTITQSSKSGSEPDAIHIAWYCINTGQARLQDYDIDIVRALADEVPVLLVLTQCIDDEVANALEEVIKEEQLPIEGRPVRVLARERRVGNHKIPPRGLEELAERTNEILPGAVRRAFINALGVAVRLKANRARAVVAASSATAAGIGAAPIPVPDAAVLMPVQLAMLASITAVFGVDTSNDRILRLVRGLVGQRGVEAVGQRIAANLLKVLPGVNVINAAVAAALTAALGEAYIQLCSEMFRRQATGKPMPEAEMLPFLLDAYQKAFKKPRGLRGKSPRAKSTGRAATPKGSGGTR